CRRRVTAGSSPAGTSRAARSAWPAASAWVAARWEPAPQRSSSRPPGVRLPAATSERPSSSHSLSPGQNVAHLTTCQDREPRRGYHAPLDSHAGRRRTTPNGALTHGGRAVDKRGTRRGRAVDTFFLDERDMLSGTLSLTTRYRRYPHAVGDPSRQGRHVDRARPAR